MTYLVEIVCDLQHPEAMAGRGTSCTSRRGNGANPQYEAASVDVAASVARQRAETAGWRVRVLQKLGRRRGMLCPACVALYDRDRG